MVNVDIASPVQRVSTVAPRPGGAADGSAAHDNSKAVRDAVNLSSDAKRVMKEQMEGQTIAEAYMKHMLAKDPRPADASQQTDQDDQDGQHKSLQQQAKKALQLTIDDIGWLLDALGIDPSHHNTIANAVEGRASIDLASAPAAVIALTTATATRTDLTPAIFVEDLSLSVSKNSAEVTVKRVTLTTIHGSAKDRVSDSNQPMVIDVGGQLKPGISSSETTQARSGHSIDQTDEPYFQGTASNDQRYNSVVAAEVVHGMLIVREGGRMQADNTLKLRLDALMPLPTQT